MANNWKRPLNLEEAAEEYFDEQDQAGFTSDWDAFLSGALWCALVAEGRIDIDAEVDE